MISRRVDPDPAGTGGARCGQTTSRRHDAATSRRREGGCGQPIRWGRIEDAKDPQQSKRIALEPGPDPDGLLLQTGRYAGAPLVRMLRKHEPVPAGAKRWTAHAASCRAGQRPVRQPRTVQLPLPLGDVQACPAGRAPAAVTAAVR